MKFIITNITLIVFFIINCSMHPVHVTVTNIDFNSSNKTFDISMKLFLDDFQNVILKNHQVE